MVLWVTNGLPTALLSVRSFLGVPFAGPPPCVRLPFLGTRSPADLAAEINASVENIGARRLATVLERLLEEISFTATDRAGEAIAVDAAMVRDRVAPLAASADLSRFIL